jgi:predicted metal-dependent phosphoesterase TrpH
VLENKADIHIHTTYSDGLMTPEAVVEYAATETQLSVIAITDHDTIAGAVAARRYWQCNQRDLSHLDIIIGSEITSRDGDIVGLFLKEDVPAGLSAAETVQAIHAQSGLAIAVHPLLLSAPDDRQGGWRTHPRGRL